VKRCLSQAPFPAIALFLALGAAIAFSQATFA
jgi:hypothetical protein